MTVQQGRLDTRFPLQTKCHQYWPDPPDVMEQGNFRIRCQSEDCTIGYVFREMLVTNTEVSSKASAGTRESAQGCTRAQPSLRRLRWWILKPPTHSAKQSTPKSGPGTLAEIVVADCPSQCASSVVLAGRREAVCHVLHGRHLRQCPRLSLGGPTRLVGFSPTGPQWQEPTPSLAQE